jgi:hypothetical protein
MKYLVGRITNDLRNRDALRFEPQRERVDAGRGADVNEDNVEDCQKINVPSPW